MVRAKAKGQITVIDLTDSRSLIAYVASSNRRQVIYDPNTEEYFPNYSENPNTLFPELYIAGGGNNIISQAKSVKWTVQTNSMGTFDPIVANSDYEYGNDSSLVIKGNVLQSNLSMLYRVEITYHDSTTNRDILIQADIELVRLSNGSKGTPGEGGQSSYLHIKHSNDGGETFTSSNGDDAGEWIGTYVDFNETDPMDISKYTWTKVTGEDGQTPHVHYAWANVVENTNSGEEQPNLITNDFIIIRGTDNTPSYTVDVVQNSDTDGVYHSVTHPTGGNIYNQFWEGGDEVVRLSEPLIAGETYTLLFDYKTDQQTDKIFNFRFYNLESAVDYPLSSESDWTTKVHTFTQAGTSDEDIAIGFGAIEQGKTLSWRNFRIIEGTPESDSDYQYADFSVEESEGRSHIGVYTDFNETPKTEPESYRWTKVTGEDATLLTIETPDGTTIRNNEGTLTAVSEMYVGTLRVSNGITYKWYKRRPQATGDAHSGAGWQRLSSSTNFGTTGYTSPTLTIPPEAITGNATYMVIVTYQGNNFRRQVTVNDITDPYTVAVLGDSFFRNGQGQNTYTAKLYRNGEEVDPNGAQGYTYTWHQYTSTGVKVNNFEKTGKTITVTSAEFSGKADLRVTVTR